MLQAAATTHTKMRAGWCDPVCRGYAYLQCFGLGVAAAVTGETYQHFFARQRPINKHHLAFMMRDASPFMAELGGGEQNRFLLLHTGTLTGSHVSFPAC